MDSKYDRVSYPDNVYLAGQNEPEMEEFGTGVYPTVSQRTRYKEPSFKLACIEAKRKPPVFLIIAAVVLLFIIVLIAVIAHSVVMKQSQQEKHKQANVMLKNTNAKSYGLFFYPQVDGKSLIRFYSKKSETYMKYYNNLNYHMHNYSTVIQRDGKYMECDDDHHNLPDGKVCRYDATNFNEMCTEQRFYGFNVMQPCVLLVLKLPEGMIPKLFGKDSNVTDLLAGRWSPNRVGISCDGDTPEDQSFIGHQHILGEPIVYSPPSGFPLYMFAGQSLPQYVAPAVMVQFRTVTPLNTVTIKCVAWAQYVHNGHSMSSDFYTAKFQLDMEE